MAPYYDNPSLFPMNGGCACGFIRYTLSKPPLIVHCCHCTSCQRETGSAFALHASIEPANLTLDPSSRPTVPAGPTIPAAPAGPDLAAAPPFLYINSADPATPDVKATPSTSFSNPVRFSSPSAPPPHFIPLPTESGIPQTVARCPRCGCAVWTHYLAGSGRHLAAITVGTLDRAFEIDPDVHIFIQSKRSFITIDDGKPQFETFYKSEEDAYPPQGLERYRRLLPEIKVSRDAAKAELAARPAKEKDGP